MTVHTEYRAMTGSRPRGAIRRILLATDLSAASEGAAVQALELAHDLGAELLIVSVIDARSRRSSWPTTSARSS